MSMDPAGAFLLERCFCAAVLTAVNKAPARSNDF